MTDLVAPVRARRRPNGPPPGIVGAVTLALSLASVVVPLAGAGIGFPTASATPVATATYFAAHPVAATLTGFFAFGASVPLGIYAATMYAAQLRLGIRVPGPGISFFGGIAASVLLAVSGLVVWALAGASAAVPAGVVRLMADLAFALGGVGFASGVGLLIAGIGVPGMVLRLFPGWLAWSGLALAAVSELAFFSMLWDGFDVLLPVSRFGGLLWLAVVGFLLPSDRHRVPRRAASAG